MENSITEGPLFKGVSDLLKVDDLKPYAGVALIKKGRLIATDSYILVRSKLSAWDIPGECLAILEDKVLNVDVLQMLGKHAGLIEISDKGFTLLGKNNRKMYTLDFSGSSDGLQVDLGDEKFKYPDVDSIIPDEVPGTHRVSLDPHLLASIAKIFEIKKGEGLRLVHFKGGNVVCRSVKNDAHWALLKTRTD